MNRRCLTNFFPAKSLLENLLVADPAHRYTASEVASHPWTMGSSENTRPPNVLALMKDYAKTMGSNDELSDLTVSFQF